MADFQEQDPAFSRRAAAVVGSRFWFYGEEAPGGEAWLAWENGRREMRERVAAAAQKARRYEGLAGEDKALFDAAEAFDAKGAK